MQSKKSTLIPRDIIFRNPDRSGVLVSGDGKFLAYIAPNQNNVANVWIRTLGKSDDRMITSDSAIGIRAFRWRPDNKHILYRQDINGDERFHILQTNIDTGETRDLTPFDGSSSVFIGLEESFPDEVLIAINKRNKRLYDVYRLNLNTGDIAEDTRNPGDVTSWAADHKMQIRAAQALLPDGTTELRLRANGMCDWQTLMTYGPDELTGTMFPKLRIQNFEFSPDDASVYVVSSVDANAVRLLEVRIADGEQQVLAEDPNFDVTSFKTHPTLHHIEAVEFHRERSEWNALRNDVKADFEFLQEQCTGCFSITSSSQDNSVWIVADDVDDGSLRYYIYDRSKKSLELIFLSQPKLDEYLLVKKKPVSFTARDGMKIYGYLAMPNSAEEMIKSGKRPPLILRVHGGLWARVTAGFHSEVQWLANRGYSVFQINYRGSTGYGKDYCNAGDRESGGKIQDDLIDGKQWAVEQGIADVDNVGIFGTSYGGYATLVGLAFTPDEFVCGVDLCGPSNLVTHISDFPPHWAAIKAIYDKRVGRVDTEKEFLESRSPLFKVDQIKAPLLIGQGANDPRVRKSESDQMVEALRKNGKEVEYVVLEDEGHSIAKPKNRMKFYAVAEAFLAKHLGGEFEPND